MALTYRKNLTRNLTPNEVDSNFEDLVKNFGRVIYTDDQYTQASPFVINQGQTLKLPNNAASVLKKMYDESIEFYDPVTGKVLAEKLNNGFDIRISFQAFTSSNTGYGEIHMDIGGSIGQFVHIPVQFPRGSGVNNTREVNEYSKYYCGSTFVANGADILFESVRGNTSIWDISFYISKRFDGDLY